jgi:hypothetical protein
MEVEEVSSHEAVGQDVTAGQLFDLGLIEFPAGGLFGADCEAGSAESRYLCRMHIVTAGHQNPSGALSA